jgi:hypothetical protein
MRINEFLRDLTLGLQSFNRKWGRFILTFAVTMLGLYIAFVAFQFLNDKGVRSRVQTNKDTVYVRLVNGNINGITNGNAGTTPYAPPKTDSKTDSTTDTSTTSSRAALPNIYLNQEINRFFNYRKIPAARPITPAAQKDATDLALLSMHVFPWWTVLLSALLTLLGICYIFYNSLPYYSIEMNRDVDPDALTVLFNKFGREIQSLGNPRKIKRLSNKIRFQYHYLVYKELASGANLDHLVRTLLLFERANTLSGMKPEESRQITRDQKSFAEFLVKNNILSTDERYMRIMYALNKDSFY